MDARGSKGMSVCVRVYAYICLSVYVWTCVCLSLFVCVLLLFILQPLQVSTHPTLQASFCNPRSLIKTRFLAYFWPSPPQTYTPSLPPRLSRSPAFFLPAMRQVNGYRAVDDVNEARALCRKLTPLTRTKNPNNIKKKKYSFLNFQHFCWWLKRVSLSSRPKGRDGRVLRGSDAWGISTQPPLPWRWSWL